MVVDHVEPGSESDLSNATIVNIAQHMEDGKVEHPGWTLNGREGQVYQSVNLGIAQLDRVVHMEACESLLKSAANLEQE